MPTCFLLSSAHIPCQYVDNALVYSPICDFFAGKRCPLNLPFHASQQGDHYIWRHTPAVAHFSTPHIGRQYTHFTKHSSLEYTHLDGWENVTAAFGNLSDFQLFWTTAPISQNIWREPSWQGLNWWKDPSNDAICGIGGSCCLTREDDLQSS